MSPSPSQLEKYGKYGTTNLESVCGDMIKKYAPIHGGLEKGGGGLEARVVVFILQVEALHFGQVWLVFG